MNKTRCINIDYDFKHVSSSQNKFIYISKKKEAKKYLKAKLKIILKSSTMYFNTLALQAL